MARRRKKRTTTAKKRTGGTKKHVAKRRRKRSKSGLSEMISHEGIKRTGKAYIGGLTGGVIAAGIDALLPKTSSVFWRVGANGLVALIAGGAMDMPSISAGLGGATGYQLGQKITGKLLSEMEEDDLADDDALSEYPDALDENGNPMFLADDAYVDRGLADPNEFYYLEEIEEMELAEEQYALAESFQANDMYPRFVNSSKF